MFWFLRTNWLISSGASHQVALTAVWSLLSFSAGNVRGGNLLSNCQRYNTIMILDAETDLGQDVEDHHVVDTAVQAETGNYQKFTNHQSVRRVLLHRIWFNAFKLMRVVEKRNINNFEIIYKVNSPPQFLSLTDQDVKKQTVFLWNHKFIVSLWYRVISTL